jgi:Ca-activated chloride channel family protein
MRTPTHSLRNLFLGLATLLVALGGGHVSAGEPAKVGPAAGPSPGAVLLQLASLQRGSMQLPEGGGGPGRTLAPYFVVADGGTSPGAGDAERLPLEETRADVAIAGPIARVKVTQVFRNRGSKPIEAVYVFPASTRAAVHGMRLKIGERTVEARIERKAEARAQYDQARTDGKRAALLDEERPNVFTMHVANVMPGDRIVAELDYSELVVPEQGVYELVYPTVVGPRYGGGADPKADTWIANPTLTEGKPAPYKFGFQAHLESAIPVKDLSSPSHDLAVSWVSPRAVNLAVKGEDGGNRDVVLRWRLSGDAVEAGALLFPDDQGGGWFLATIEPPARVKPEIIPPREYVFVLDVSGSMHGFPLDTAKALMNDLLPRLRSSDSFNIVFFSGGSFVLSPGASLPANPANVKKALDTFAHLQGGGGTELLQALRTAYDLPRADARVARSVVVVTDGYVGVEAQAFRLVRERLPEASCYAFGIGSSVNRGLIEGLARAGQGEPTVVLQPKDAQAAADRLERIISAPVLSQLHYEVKGLDARDVLPGALPDLLAERPVTLLGRYLGAPGGKIVLTGQSAAGPYRKELDLSGAAPRRENGPLRVLWARRWVELLMDEHHMGPAKEIEEAVTALGLAHHLLTPFTSFVAVDSEIVNRGGQGDTVKQPLPLPQGVSNLAVGGLGAAPAEARRVRSKSGAFGALGAMGTGAPGPAAPAPATDALVEREEKSPDRDDAAKKDGLRQAPSAVTVLRETHAGLASATQLREAVKAALAPLVAQGLRGEVEVRLTIGASGKVLKVEVLRAPDAAAKAQVEQALRGLSTGVPPKAKAAVWVGTVRLG